MASTPGGSNLLRDAVPGSGSSAKLCFLGNELVVLPLIAKHRTTLPPNAAGYFRVSKL
jgi:hypothetical protein